ncbi:hypothetical protein ABZ923_00005 [Streptomyces sp. NPDC046881]|uniref:hypothetical protein n=1 Tax=Streptomyces sp. NPDC046881 TaxID=3155374 RepID=UPI0033EEC5C9
MADPARCWTAAEAARLADAGIGAARAYELRADGESVRTVEELIAQDAVAVTEASREALELLADATETVPDDLAEALPRARTHTTVALDEWTDDHRSPFGPQGSGVWVRLTRHDFGLADGSTRSLWEVSDGWWDYGADADAGETTTLFPVRPQRQDRLVRGPGRAPQASTVGPYPRPGTAVPRAGRTAL